MNNTHEPTPRRKPSETRKKVPVWRHHRILSFGWGMFALGYGISFLMSIWEPTPYLLIAWALILLGVIFMILYLPPSKFQERPARDTTP